MTAEAAEDAVFHAATLLDAGRPADALAALRPALAYDPHDADVLRLQSLALSRLGRHDEAVAAASASVAAAPADAYALRALGAALFRRGDNEQAVAVADRACAVAPQDTASHLLRAETLLEAKRPFDAREAAWEAIRLDPNSAAAYDMAGRAELDAWNPRGAEGAFRAALRLRPDDGAYLNNLGVALRSQGDDEGAAEMFAAAARADPTLEVARENTSGLLSDIGWVAGWLPLYVSWLFARGLFKGGQPEAGVAVIVLGALVAVVLTGRRVRGALRRYFLDATRMRLPTRDRVIRYAAAAVALAAVLAASTRVAYRDRLLTAALAEAALLFVFVRWARGWRRRVPPPTVRPAPAGARLLPAVADLGTACLLGAVLVAPFWGRAEVDAALGLSFAVVPLLYLGWVDGLGGSRLRVSYGAAYVVDTATGRPPGFRRGLTRAVVKVLTLPVAAIAVAAGARPPHDAVARTAVVRGIGF
ncbi:MAG TPA: tetratricopeptide repeat protein [Frankiaceae bacterium]|nr:tetratricopeptide repeat protein [Frankiaceae bacterium]